MSNKTPSNIATELVRGCPSDTLADHEVIADAITGGDSVDDILAMAIDYPETYMWLKIQFGV